MTKMHLKMLFMLGLSMSLVAAGANSSHGHHGHLTGTSSLTPREKVTRSSHNHQLSFSNNTLRTTVISSSTQQLPNSNRPTSTPKLLTNPPPEAIETAFVPTLYKQDTTTEYFALGHNDQLKNLNGTFPNTTSEPKTTVVNVSGEFPASSNPVVHDSSANLFLQGVTTSLLVPVLGDKVKSVRFENNTHSDFNNSLKDDQVIYFSDFNNADTEENVAFPTEIFKFNSEPDIAIPMDDILTELNQRNPQQEPNLKELINNSSEMTILLETLPVSDNFENINETNVTTFESPEGIEPYKIKELSINLTTPKDQVEENLDSSLSKRQDKSSSIDNQQQRANFIPSSGIKSSNNSNAPPTVLVSEFSDLSMDNLTRYDINTTENVTTNNSNSKSISEVATETTSITKINHQTFNENSSEPTDSNIILFVNKNSVLNNDEEYTAVIPKICSNNSTINRLLDMLNTLPNSKRMTSFSCESLKDMKIMLKSKALFDKVNEFLKTEAKTDEMVIIKVRPNSTLAFEIFSQSSYDGIFIPKLAIIIFGNLVLFFLIVLLFVFVYKKKCRKHTTSLDLHHIPHLSLKTDYNLTPIPRPSISFPEGNRDFLNGYAQDNNSRPRQDNNLLNGNTLNPRNSLSSVAKTYEEVDKEAVSRQEMHTFAMSPSKKCEFRASAGEDYASPNSWDRLQEKNYSRKYGVENPGYRKW